MEYAVEEDGPRLREVPAENEVAEDGPRLKEVSVKARVIELWGVAGRLLELLRDCDMLSL